MRGYVRRIVVGLGKLLLAVVVGAAQDGAGPVCEEALGLALDDELGPLALDVEHDDLADARGDEGVLVDGQLGQRGEELFLDVVGGQTAVAEGLEEEADGFEDVGLGVDDGLFEVALVEQGDDLGQQLELVAGGLAALAALVVGLGGLGHAAAHVLDLLVGHLLEVDSVLLAAAAGGALDDGVHGAVERALPACRLLAWDVQP